jgi:ABC-type transport system involved in multi-copper enzyme maturation permease subunit
LAALTLGRTIKAVTVAPIRWLRHALTLVIGNPVIAREMKVRMRFARTFWLQGIYLLTLIAITAIAYHAIFVITPIQNPQELQVRLQAFYHTLLYSLITLIVLIAPALTAGAIAFERERRTLDLLLLTPLRPMQILVGKLVASMAFLLLLLTLALPVLTVGILMGGATVGDLLATYALLVFSTLHLCAFALYCSACNRNSGLQKKKTETKIKKIIRSI